MAVAKTTKKKMLEKASLYIGVIAGALTIGGMAFNYYKKQKAKTAGVNGYFIDDEYFDDYSDDNDEYFEDYEEEGGVNGFDLHADENVVSIG